MVGLKPSEVPPTTAVKFLGAGTAACFADLLTFPLDTAKVRLQVGALWPRVITPISGGAEFSTRAPAVSARSLFLTADPEQATHPTAHNPASPPPHHHHPRPKDLNSLAGHARALHGLALLCKPKSEK